METRAIYGVGNDSGMENIGDATTAGGEVAIPNGARSTGDALTSQAKPISPPAKGAATTRAARHAKRQMPQKKQLTQVDGTAQEWLEILWQTRRNGQRVGLVMPCRTVWRNDEPMIVVAIRNAFICGSCGTWTSCATSLKARKCHNPNCGIEQTK